MLWVLIVKDTLYLHRKKPIILKPVEATVEEENFRQRFSINELVYPRLINRGYLGAGVQFYQMIGGMIPTVGYSFSVRGLPPTSNALYINGIPLLNLMLSSLAPLPVSEDIISSALVYRGDAPVEYDGFLGGIIDMKVEPYGGAAKVGVPTTYIFHKGLFGQYSNPTYVQWYDEPRWRTENYSGALIQRLFRGRANLSVLYAHTWLDFKSKFKGLEDAKKKEKESKFWDETDMVGVSVKVLDNLQAHVSYGSTGNILKNTYGSLLFGEFETRRLLSGITLKAGGIGIHLTYDRVDNRSDLFSLYKISFYSEHVALSPFAEMERESERMKLYAGVRLNAVYTTCGPDEYSHNLKGVIPTFRLKVKYFKGENEAYKATVSTGYQYMAPFFPIGNVDLIPSSYFNRYIYGGMLTLGKETLHKLAITELNVYLGAYDPFVFYNWGLYEGPSARTFLKYAVNATVLSYGVDLTVADRSKNRFRVSATLGSSRFVRGVEGASPWERRYSFSLSTPYLSIIFAEGIPTYGWYYSCVESEGPICQEYKVTYTYNRTSPTLMVGSGREMSFRGFSVGFGVGNFLFFFNRIVSTTKVDPTALYLAYPIVYLHIAKRW